MEIQKVKLQMIKEPCSIYTAEKINSAIDIIDLVNKYEQYDLTPNEKLILVGLNSKNNVNIYTEIANGGGNCATFKVNDIIKPLMLSNCDKFILAHNHPSGDTTPSKIDFEITDRVQKASNLIGLDFLDHIIIGENGYTSILHSKGVKK